MRFLDAVIPGQAAAVSTPPRRGPAGRVRSAVNFGGHTYQGFPVATSWGKNPAEPIGVQFDQMIDKALNSCAPIAAVEHVRVAVFSQARFLWQRMNNGRPGDMFGSPDLRLFERPWTGGVTSDLLARMLLHADFAGNAYVARVAGRLTLLRPDWTDILLADLVLEDGGVVGFERVGYAYYHGGDRRSRPVIFLADEVAHFAPDPDPVASYRGRSWLQPVLAEIAADKQATVHKGKFFENAATPNLAVALPKEIDVDDFEEFVEKFEQGHEGAENAYKTLYVGGGADVKVVGADFAQMDFKSTQGAGETRIAAAGGVGSVLAKLSEGLQGSSLNAGNFTAAKRLFAETTAQLLWQNAAGSLEVLVSYRNAQGQVDPAVRLWFDDDIPFVRDDAAEVAGVQSQQSVTIRQYVDGGFEPASAVAAVRSNDLSLLVHTGRLSVQLQDPGAGSGDPADPAGGGAGGASVDPSTPQEADASAAARYLQQIYLAVGKVLTVEEARDVVAKASGLAFAPKSAAEIFADLPPLPAAADVPVDPAQTGA